MIRAQVSWWPGNVEVGGTHIHHLVWGILLLMIAGWVGIVVRPEPPGREIVAAAFGIGTGLTLDEFALWLELKDVYWSADGRKSIDAVIVAGIARRASASSASRSGSMPPTMSRSPSTRSSASSASAASSSRWSTARRRSSAIALLGLVVPFLSTDRRVPARPPDARPGRGCFYRSDKKQERARQRFEGRRMLEPPHVPSMRHVRESLRPRAGRLIARTGAGQAG